MYRFIDLLDREKVLPVGIKSNRHCTIHEAVQSEGANLKRLQSTHLNSSAFIYGCKTIIEREEEHRIALLALK
jgi:hypothetical protein